MRAFTRRSRQLLANPPDGRPGSRNAHWGVLPHLKVFWFSYDDHTGDSERQMKLFQADIRRGRKTLYFDSRTRADWIKWEENIAKDFCATQTT